MMTLTDRGRGGGTGNYWEGEKVTVTPETRLYTLIAHSSFWVTSYHFKNILYNNICTFIL